MRRLINGGSGGGAMMAMRRTRRVGSRRSSGLQGAAPNGPRYGALRSWDTCLAPIGSLKRTTPRLSLVIYRLQDALASACQMKEWLCEYETGATRRLQAYAW
jgi:hypothetical protein